MKKAPILYTIAAITALPWLCAAACRSDAPEYESLYRFNGGAGDTISEPFTISTEGQAVLVLLTDPPTGGIEVSLFRSDDDETPVMQGEWITTPDSFDNIPPGEYYLKVQVENLPVPASIVSTGFLIEIRDWPAD